MQKQFEVFLSEEKIKSRVKELAAQINAQYEGQDLHVVAVLKGSFIFLADLVREIKVPITIDFIKASSYGASTHSSGEVKIDFDITQDIKDKNVLVVEDIVDSGLTMDTLLRLFSAREPRSLKLAALLYKPSRNVIKVPIDYLCFEIEDRFVIGYGLDYNQKFRELPYIGIYNES